MEIKEEIGTQMLGLHQAAISHLAPHKHSGLTSRRIRRLNSHKKKMLESAPLMESKPRGFGL